MGSICRLGVYNIIQKSFKLVHQLSSSRGTWCAGNGYDNLNQDDNCSTCRHKLTVYIQLKWCLLGSAFSKKCNVVCIIFGHGPGILYEERVCPVGDKLDIVSITHILAELAVKQQQKKPCFFSSPLFSEHFCRKKSRRKTGNFLNVWHVHFVLWKGQ